VYPVPDLVGKRRGAMVPVERFFLVRSAIFAGLALSPYRRTHDEIDRDRSYN
jgi:hypothetical protein